MSTLADELLQDFEDSGSEEGNEQQNGPALLDGGGVARSSLAHTNGDRAMEDADEVYVKDEDFEMVGVEGSDVKAIDDPEEAKAKVEKMKLGGVQDVHSVATLMRTLRPVLDVSFSLFFSFNKKKSSRRTSPGYPIFDMTRKRLHLRFWSTDLTSRVARHRKSPSIRRRQFRPPTSAISNPTPSTRCSPRRISSVP